MKTIVSAFLCFFLTCNCVFSQTEQYLILGFNTGIGASIERVNLGNVTFTDDFGNSITIPNYKVLAYGYHIPISIPIMYARSNWRIGLNGSYEYINLLAEKMPTSTPTTHGPNGDVTKSINISYSLIKIGGVFEYDFWHKKKNALGFTAEFGYYGIVKYTYSTLLFHDPFLYGNIGLQASYTLPKGFALMYCAGLDIQGYTSQIYYTPKYQVVFFQPRVNIGFRKSFSFKSKSH
jgi:hypothetical protein